MKPPLKRQGMTLLLIMFVSNVFVWNQLHAREYIVDTTLDSVTLDGLISLREAVNASNTDAPSGDALAGDGGGDVIRFSPKIIDGTIALTASLILVDPALSIHNDLPRPITLDGGGGLRILEVAAASVVDLKGLTLANGFDLAQGGAALINSAGSLTFDHTTVMNSVAADGGGVYNDGGTLTLADSNFENNIANGASGSGGAIFNATGGALNITDTIFTGNLANRAGGAIEDQAGAGILTTLKRVDFFENNAGVAPATAAPGNGGAIHITGPSDMNIIGGTVQENLAAREGGGFWNGAGTMTIDGTEFIFNEAQGDGPDDGGGAIFNNGGPLNITDASLFFNTALGASGSGGGLLSINGPVNLTGTRFILNGASRAGGGIEIVDGTLTANDIDLRFNNAGPNPGNGGGLHVTGTNSTISISDSLVEGNTAEREGGGLWNQVGTTMTVLRTTLNDNVARGANADDGGGALFNNGGNLIVTDCEVISNLATGTSGSGGGLLNVSAGTVTISSSRFEDNTSIRAGGAIEDNAGGGITITDCDLVSNTTGGNPGNGGALHISGAGSVSITDSDVSRNVADNEGGGLWNSGAGTLDIRDTAVAFNRAPDGGGLFAQAGTGTMTMINSTVGLNTGDNGAGVQIEGGTNTFIHVTIASNIATTVGGGFNVIAGNVNLSNTLIGDNAAPTGPDFNGTATTATGVLLENPAGAVGILAGVNVIGMDPMLMSYARTGDRSRSFIPMTGSPAIDFVASTELIDQRNLPRPAALADIGSVERQATEIQIDVTTFADVVNALDGVTSLREAITQANATAGPNIIGLQDGTYPISIAGAFEDAAASGDFDITDDLLITGTSLGNSQIDAAGLDRAVHLIGAASLEIEELDLVNGSADNGGGLENSGGNLIANRVLFSGNVANAANGSGGGLRNDVGGSITLTKCIFDQNTANRAGGGIEDISGTAANTLVDVDFTSNNAGVAPATAAPGNGGAIHISGSGSMAITGGSVTLNVAASEGGGFWNSVGTMDVTGTDFLENDAQGAAADTGGGALFNNGGTLNLTDITALDNSASGASGSGGGLLSTNGTVTILDSSFENNTASRAGGAIELIEGALLFTNSDMVNNSTGPAPGNGGGLHITRGAGAILTDATVIANVADREGGGLWNGTGTMLVQGMTLISGNSANGPASDDGGGGIFNNGGVLNLTGADVLITDNDALGTSGSGGGIFNNVGGVLTVTDAIIERNIAIRAGGGIEDQSGPGLGVTLDGAVLDANITGGGPGNGGGLHITGPGDTVVNNGTIVRYNTATAEGGGLWNGTGLMTVNSADVFGNIASGAPADQGGGGLFNAGGILDIPGPNVTVRGNDADGSNGSGGGILTDGGTLSVGPAVVSLNLASRAGGGIEGSSAPGPISLVGTTMDGNLTGSAPGNGGALHVTGVGPVSADTVTVRQNCAASEGGGFWNNQGSMTVTDSIFTGNDGQGGLADHGGGGLFNNGGTLAVDNTLIASNVASGASGSGGGLLSVGGTVTFDMVQILTNIANRAGGGIEVINGILSLTDSVLNENVAGPAGTAAPGNGGGIHVSGTAGTLVTVTRTDVKRNFAAREGGGLWNQVGSTMIVEDDTCLKSNIAAGPAANDGGGALFNNGGELIIDGSASPILVCSNAATGAAGQGGGLLSVGGTVTMDDTTLSANTASGPGADTTGINGAKISPMFDVTSFDTLVDATSAYGQDFTGQTGGTDYDQLTATGPVELGGSMLMVGSSGGFAPLPGTVYTLIAKSGAAPVTGTYGGLPEGATVVVSGIATKISYAGNDGNDVILTAITPPSFTNCTPSSMTFSACTTPADLPDPIDILATATSGCNVVTSFVETAVTSISGMVVQVETFFVIDDCGITGTCERVFSYPEDVTPPSFSVCDGGSVSQPGITVLTASADGSQEVPPVTNAFSGSATFTYDANAGTISWSIVHNVTNATAAHIHGPALPGMNAGVLVNLGSATSPMSGTASISPADAAFLLDGMAYLNIHSPTFMSGAIRGQIMPQPNGGMESISLTCGDAPTDPALVLASVSDDCDVVSADVVASTNGNEITHTFTAVDSAGNIGICVQTFTVVEDTEAPFFADCGAGTAEQVGITALTAIADGSQEVPPVTNAFSGTAVFIYDVNAGTVSWHITHDVTNATSAHIHGPAAPGAGAGVLVNLGSATSPMSGTAPISATDAASLLGGMTYLNIHSPTFPGGAIRGQILANQPGVKVLAANPTGAQEVPPVTNSFGGSATFVLDANNGNVSWFITHNVTNATAAHIHGPAAAGANASVLVNLGSATSPMSGTAPISAAGAMAVSNGMAYLNIHSPVFPSGAIRGQIVMPGMAAMVMLDSCSPVLPDAADVLSSANDNCGVAASSMSESTVTNGGMVMVTRTYTASDDAGNTGICSQVYGYTLDAEAPAFACTTAPINLMAMADASQEVPPVTNDFTAMANFTYDADAGMISWTIIHTVTNATAAHIHGPAGVGTNSGVLVNLAATGAASPITGSAPISAADANIILSGLAYLNIHSPVFPNGAVRGQIMPKATTFVAAASGDQEVPPATNSFTATGVFDYDPATGMIAWNITHDVAGVSAAHIHGPANPGANAGVLINLGNATSPIIGSAPISASDAAILLSGMAYLNIHSTDFPGGAVRGQLTLATDLGCMVSGLPSTEVLLASATDNCAVTSTNVSENLTMDGCRTILVRTFSASDAAGNTETCVTTFTYTDDSEAPSFGAAVALIEMGCNPVDLPPSADLVFAEITDNCELVSTTMVENATIDGCFVTITRDFTAVDGCGNTGTFQQVITLSNDTTAPDFNSCDLPDLDLGCNPESIPAPIDPMSCAVDNCGIVTAMMTEASSTNVAAKVVDCSVTLIRTYTAIDACGNTGTTEQVITYTEDTTSPDLAACNVMDQDLGCNPVTIPDPLAFTNCVVEACGVVSVDLSAVTNVTGIMRTLVRTYTVTDECGNSSEATETITWTVDCFDNVVLTKTAVVGTDCSQAGIDIEATPGDTITYCFSLQNNGQTTLSNVQVTDLLLSTPVTNLTVATTVAPGQTVLFELPDTFQNEITNVATIAFASGNSAGGQAASTPAVVSRASGKIRGWVFLDLANNSSTNGINLQTLGLQNITIDLFQNGIEIDSTTTGTGDDSGMYLFCDLLEGTYEVRIDIDTVDEDLQDRADRLTATVTVGRGGLVDNVNFGFTPVPTAISLADFNAALGPEGLSLNWTTASESETLGFSVRINGETVGDLILAEGKGTYSVAPFSVSSGDEVDLVEIENDLKETLVHSMSVAPPQDGWEAAVLTASGEPAEVKIADVDSNLLIIGLESGLTPYVGDRELLGRPLEDSGTLYLGLPANTILRLR